VVNVEERRSKCLRAVVEGENLKKRKQKDEEGEKRKKQKVKENTENKVEQNQVRGEQKGIEIQKKETGEPPPKTVVTDAGGREMTPIKL
tara:strand:- start:3164 stop:3430 length:267 start_codon:yes stop_codon:yes gene_type:complete